MLRPLPFLARSAVIASLCGALLGLFPVEAHAGDANEAAAQASFAPEPISTEDFAALRSSSPFLRPLDLAQSLVLTGIAEIEGDLFATLVDRETKVTHVVSKSLNLQGWRMVEIEGDRSDFLTLTAKIAMAGGEVFSVRFDDRQLEPPEPRRDGSSGRSASGRSTPPTAANYREGISGDGFRGPPPPDLVEKMSRMSEEQRERLVSQIGEIRSRNPEMNSEARQALFRRMVDRMAQERR